MFPFDQTQNIRKPKTSENLTFLMFSGKSKGKIWKKRVKKRVKLHL